MKYSIEQVKQIIGDNIKIKNVEFLGAGNHSEAFCINNNMVIKLPKHKKASNCLKIEIKVLEQLQGLLNLEIPNVIIKSNFKSNGEDLVYFVSKKLNGNKISKKDFLALPQYTKEKCANIIANFLFTLHHQKQILDIKRKDFSLLHGDFSLNHILFDSNNLPCAVLDFGDARVGKVLSDFIYLLDDKDDEEFGKEFGLKVLDLYNQCANKK